MGPLVPEIISNEFNLVVALLIGIGFGFVLEQAGFSSTKKLVGLFYGYDFTVLRVFFTAGVTAMIGVLVLGHYGLLDLSLIYVNPTFLRSAIIGGLIMGAGFIIGGFCPGTSVCAASVGKIDAMIFIIGSVFGVLIFTEAYDSLENLYMADALGPVTMPQQFGITPNLFGFILTIVALAAFYFTWRIENNVNGIPHTLTPDIKRNYTIAIAVPLIFMTLLTILPSKKDIIENKIAEDKRLKKCVFHEISADKLAYEIINNYYKLNVIDVRSPEEYKKYHLPLAINIPFSEIRNREWENIFKQTIKTNVFYADNDSLVRLSCLQAKYIGDSKNVILTEHALEFRDMFFNVIPPHAEASKTEHELYTFRSQSATQMNRLKEALQNIGKPVKKEVSTAQGGCS